MICFIHIQSVKNVHCKLQAVERAGKAVCADLMTSLTEPEPDLLTSGKKGMVSTSKTKDH